MSEYREDGPDYRDLLPGKLYLGEITRIVLSFSVRYGLTITGAAVTLYGAGKLSMNQLNAVIQRFRNDGVNPDITCPAGSGDLPAPFIIHDKIDCPSSGGTVEVAPIAHDVVKSEYVAVGLAMLAVALAIEILRRSNGRRTRQHQAA